MLTHRNITRFQNKQAWVFFFVSLCLTRQCTLCTAHSIAMAHGSLSGTIHLIEIQNITFNFILLLNQNACFYKSLPCTHLDGCVCVPACERWYLDQIAFYLNYVNCRFFLLLNSNASKCKLLNFVRITSYFIPLRQKYYRNRRIKQCRPSRGNN